MTAQFSAEVVLYLEDLVFTLRDRDYFNFLEDAERYVYDIFSAIPLAVQKQPHRQTPDSMIEFGDFYVTHNTSGRTTWYIFFSKDGDRYVVEFITNNHSLDAASFNLD